jgi:hypothetical protein
MEMRLWIQYRSSANDDFDDDDWNSASADANAGVEAIYTSSPVASSSTVGRNESTSSFTDADRHTEAEHGGGGGGGERTDATDAGHTNKAAYGYYEYRLGWVYGSIPTFEADAGSVHLCILAPSYCSRARMLHAHHCTSSSSRC